MPSGTQGTVQRYVNAEMREHPVYVRHCHHGGYRPPFLAVPALAGSE